MNRSIILAAVAVCVALSSCVNNTEKDFADDQVMFSAKTGALETRTKYGADGSSPNKTYVDWVAGDQITIAMSNNLSANYTLAVDHDGNDSAGNSRAIPSSSQTLTWSGSSPWTFWGVYPESGTNGSSLSVSGGSATASFTVPTTWTPVSTDPETLTIDGSSPAVTYGYKFSRLPYGFMFATESNVTRRTSVSLTFYPKFTAFTITLKNTSSSPVEISSVKLSSADVALAGTFYVDTSSGNVIYSGTKGIPNRDTNGDNAYVEVSFKNFTNGVLTIPGKSGDTDGEVTFTLVALPGSPITGSETLLTKLTLSVTSGSTTKNIKLGKSENNNTPTWQSFDAGKKHNISVTLPDFPSYDYDFSVINPTDLTYAGGTAHATIVSTKTPAGGSAQSASWTVDGYYTDAACTEPASGYTSFLPNGIDNGSGGGNGDISFSYAAATASAVSSKYQSVAEADIAASTFGSGSSTSKYLNLSNPTNMESDYIRESANSYIVNGTGYYKIPLVMGNGVKHNTVNTSAYNSANFVNYKGNVVSSTGPYLQNTGSTPTSAYVVWEDVNGLIEVVNTTGYVIKAGADSNKPIVEDNGVYWLRFHVNQAKQGNAVIAVTDGTDVMWSYHIWVTNYIPQNYPGYNNYDSYPGNGTMKVSPVNLGWVYSSLSSVSGTKYAGNCVYAKLIQTGSGNTAVMKIERPQHSVVIPSSSSTSPKGSSPYYQWGRKDAFLPAVEASNGTISNVTTYGKYSGLNTRSASSTISDAIKNPHAFITTTATSSAWWGSGTKSDLWNLESTNYSTSVKKTIYDPCPVGYCVPSQTLFSSYEGNGTTLKTFVTLGIKDNTSGVYYLDLGYRQYNSGAINYMASGNSSSYGIYALATVSTYPYLFHFRNSGSYTALISSGNLYPVTSGYPVRPMQDPSFDPTDDGTTRGSGTSIDWVN